MNPRKLISGKYKQIEVGFDGRVYGLSDKGDIWTRPGVEGAWLKIKDNTVVDFCVRFDGRIYAINSDYTIWTASSFEHNW